MGLTHRHTSKAISDARRNQERRNEAEEIGRETSRYNPSTVSLPTLGARARVNRRATQLFPVWQTFLIACTVYSAFVSPYECGFLEKPHGFLFIIDEVVNCFILIDIVLTAFFVSYIDTITYNPIDDRRQLFCNYAKSWMMIDFLATIPCQLTWLLTHRLVGNYYSLFIMLRLGRLKRLGAFFTGLEKHRRFNYSIVRCAKILFITLLYVHCVDCLYYRLALLCSDPKKTWIGAFMEDFLQQSVSRRYVTSVYWAVTTLTSVGYGDIHAVNTLEMTFSIFYMLCNLGLAAYSVGSVTELFIHMSSSTRQFRKLMEDTFSYAARNHLPNELRDQMVRHLELKLRTNSERCQDQYVLESVSEPIRLSVYHFLFKPFLEEVYLFRGVSDELLSQVLEITVDYFPPEEVVILRNQEPNNFYQFLYHHFFKSIYMEFIVLENGIEEVVGSANAGDIFGEIGVLCHKLQPFTVRTKRLSHMIRIDRKKFLDIVQPTSGDGTIIMMNFLEHLKERNNDTRMKIVLFDIERMLVRGKTDLPLSLCAAVLRQNDLMLHHLLKRGLDPNESDNNQRTALHIAAAKGDEKCVRLLLEFSADPNRRDSEGSVPLQEAMFRHHETVVELLTERGAELTGDIGLCDAARRENYLMLQYLLKKGSNPNESDIHQRTALHIAAAKGDEMCVRLLLESAADPNCRDSDGSVPLWEAMFGNYEKVIAILDEKRADLTIGDIGLFSWTAAEFNDLALLREIFNRNGNVTLPKNNGSTALHTAVRNGNLEIVKFLLGVEARIDSIDDDGLTPVDLSYQQANEKIQQLLQQHNPDESVIPYK